MKYTIIRSLNKYIVTQSVQTNHLSPLPFLPTHLLHPQFIFIAAPCFVDCGLSTIYNFPLHPEPCPLPPILSPSPYLLSVVYRLSTNQYYS